MENLKKEAEPEFEDVELKFSNDEAEPQFDDMELKFSNDIDKKSPKEDNPEENDEDTDLDAVLEDIGGFGRYQILISLIAVMTGVNGVYHFLVIQYMLAKPKYFWCINDGIHNMSYFNESSRMTMSNDEVCNSFQDTCKEWGYSLEDFSMEKTIVTQFELYCTSKLVFAIIRSSYFVFVGIGVATLGSVADKFGRRPVVVYGNLALLISGFLVSFAPNLPLFILARCFNGYLAIGPYSVGYVLAVELVGRKWRSFMMSVNSLYCEIIKITSGLLAFFVLDWYWLNIFGTLRDVPITLALFFIVPESPRWLVQNSREDEALDILKIIARRNGKKIDEWPSLKAKSNTTESSGKGKLSDLFRTPNVRLKTIEQCFNWFVIAMVFWAIYLNTDQYISFGMKPQIILIIFAAGNMVTADLFISVVVNYFGRRKTHAVSTYVASTCLLLSAFIPGFGKTICGVVGIIAATFAFDSIYIRASEIFPTVTRNIGLGLCSFMGRLGAVISPFIELTGDSLNPSIPAIAYATLAFIAATMALHLPETNKMKMPETLAEAEAIPCNKTFTNLCRKNCKNCSYTTDIRR